VIERSLVSGMVRDRLFAPASALVRVGHRD
jgi:hypothetical protein